ncbi:unnamed protein product [Rotaria socialis]|uniref:Winged helix Storkhead-box1 domain-containing protein n=1 Tax=Rotaria socialis TaxID=392032 RepID=A0A820VC92_9BILA|nr:unnamed protein product [Rotaria socialis]CAF3332416.1 unnamed protein product [Rotaria socialis]CAF3374116.1 unnamed protein product [Rotaria socialis]CAF3759977.1 unnamed protein product [Rotaria socialis]CAF4135258.1 unnamed protein product [Rotaria socialis]
MFDKLISQNYLLLVLNIDPSQPSALVNTNLLNIRNVYSSFITINREAHVWYQEVYHTLEKVQFGGSLSTNGLLIKGSKKCLNTIKRIYCQRLLQAPYGFIISDLVELSNIHVKRQERDPLISLPNVLCLIINDINRRSGGYGGSMDEIKTTLKLQYPEFPLPTDDILYSTIGTLIQDKILLLKNGGYTTLPCEQAKQVKTQFITKDHKLYSNEPKSIFSRLIHGFRRRDQNSSPPFAFNAQLLTSPNANLPIPTPRIVTDYGMIESNAQFRASSRSNPHTMRRASLRTHSTDTRQQQPHYQHYQQQQILPTPSSSTQMRRPRPRSFSFDEQLSIIDDDDESIVHDMPFSVAPVRPFQQQPSQQQLQSQHRRLNTSKVSSRCRARRRHRSRSLTKRTNNRPINQQQLQQTQHEWLHTTDNHQESTASEEIEDEEEDENDDENEPHFSPRSTSTAANRPRNRKPILHASDFDRRLCEATTTTTIPMNEKENSSPININNIQHHTSPVSQPSTEPDDMNLIVYSNNNNDLLNATIISHKSEMNNSMKKLSCHEKFLTIRYGSPDSGISGKT